MTSGAATEGQLDMGLQRHWSGYFVAASLVASLCGAIPVQAQDADGWATSSSAGPGLIWHEAPTLTPIRVVLPVQFQAQVSRTLIVALHGYGASAVQFEGVAKQLAADGFLVALPEATYPLIAGRANGFDWTLNQQGDPQLRARATRLLVRSLPTTVAEIRKRFTVDRVVLLGFSQGALVAMLAGLYDNSAFDGVVTFGLPAFDPGWMALDKAAPATRVRVLLFHGAQDKVAPVAISLQARDHLAGAGFDVVYKPFKGGHAVSGHQLAEVARWIREPDRRP